MGFLGDLVSATIKVATTPIAVASDVVKVATGQEPDTTSSLVESAIDDLISAAEEATGGK